MLDGLATVSERLLLSSPQVEPPEGFESRALARLDIAAALARPPCGPDPLARRGGRGAPDRRRGRGADPTSGVVVAPVATAAIVTDSGADIGDAQLLSDPTSYLLITVDNPRPTPGVRLCDLLRSDGTWENVGQWDAAEIASGVWAVGVDPELLDATAMRITSDGTVVATATFE